MPYASDAVKDYLHALVDEFVEPLLERAAARELSARTAEEGVWRAVLEAGRALLVIVLSACCRSITADAVERRGWSMPGMVDGSRPVARLRMDEDYRAKFNTTFGRIEVPLHAVRIPGAAATWTPARSFFPHYPDIRSSELLVEWECALAADHPFRKAADALLFFSHGAADVEDTTIGRHAVAVGRAVPHRWLYLSPEKIRKLLEERAVRDLDTGRPIINASTDAHALSRFVDETWNPKWKMCNGIRLWIVDKDTGQIIHLGGEYTWGDCMEVRARFEWLAEQGILPFDGDYGNGVVAQVVLLTDGIDWIATYIVPLYPDAVAILDAFHVAQQAAEAIKAAYPGKKNEKRVRALIKKARRALGFREHRERKKRRGGPRLRRHKHRASGYDGSGQRLLDELLRPLLEGAVRGRKRVKQAIAYVERNLHRTDFGALRTRGFQIGSGAMESMHRTGSQVRMKRAGCHWTEEVAQAILNLRMLALSGRWSEYWSQPQPPHLAVQPC